MGKSVFFWLLVGVLVGFFSPARAAGPARIPIQGVLYDANGVALDQTVNLTFGIYDAEVSGNQLWLESQMTEVRLGVFTVYLGDVEQIDLALFKGRDDLWLGVQVEDDTEMNRVYLGSSPFAAYAQHGSYTAGEGIAISDDNVVSSVSSIPSGAIMMFDLAACPPGWTELSAARGRAVVGLPESGTAGGTHGAALADLGARSISEVPAHTHSVDPPAANSDSTGDHAHGITDPGHLHGVPRWQANDGNSTVGLFSSTPGAVLNTSTDATGISLQNAGAHTHAVDIAEHTSGSTGAAAVDVTMPYIQMLMCRKD